MTDHYSSTDAELHKACIALDTVNNALRTINSKLSKMDVAHKTSAGRRSQTTEHRARIIISKAITLEALGQRMHKKNIIAQQKSMQLSLNLR